MVQCWMMWGIPHFKNPPYKCPMSESVFQDTWHRISPDFRRVPRVPRFSLHLASSCPVFAAASQALHLHRDQVVPLSG